jgi:DNA topoisomerase IA
MKHMIINEPSPMQGNGLQSIEEEFAKAIKPSTTAALESELEDILIAKISADEAKDWLAKEYLEHEEGMFELMQITRLPILMLSFTTERNTSI